MKNIIDAIINLVNISTEEIKEVSKSSNKMNSRGDNLEEFIKDLFAGTFNEDKEKRNEKISEVFSYLGNSSNPPDIMLKNGDAIEVKKIEVSKNKDIKAELQLNSSYPKEKLYSDSTMISKDCKEAEEWTEKDMFYVIGAIGKEGKRNNLHSLFFVYGSEYAAEENTYIKIKNLISSTLESTPGLELAKTNEIARVNKVDPLGITSLRVRGMWLIKNPWVVFDYIYERDKEKDFNFCAIINEEKYNTFNNKNLLEELSRKDTRLKIEDKNIKNPNNPAKLIKVKLITFLK